MQRSPTATRGLLFALSAAALNGSIGVLSKSLMAAGLGAAAIAFYKSLIGGLALVVFVRGAGTPSASLRTAAVCALFGIFVLFFCETQAYRYEIAANVVLALMASAALTALLLGWVLLGDRPGLHHWFALALGCTGLAVLLGVATPGSWIGIGFAVLAGAGYGLFSVLAKRLQLGGGLAVTRRLLLFGALYLSVPYLADGAPLPHLGPVGWLLLGGLALLPSIGGFYCTTQAIVHAPPAQVQMVELSEPLFAALFAAIWLHERPTYATWIGGALILLALLVMQRGSTPAACTEEV
jgi:drug/metabolite transporter, DME family